MEPLIEIRELMQFLPHRFPMLLVDRVKDLVPGKSCIGIKNVTMNEWFFQGHYPGLPIMPGVLILEAMAQAGAIVILSDPKNSGRIPVIGAIDDVKLKRPVVPGDTLISNCELLWFRSSIGRMKAIATVEGEMVASMAMTFKLIDKEE